MSSAYSRAQNIISSLRGPAPGAGPVPGNPEGPGRISRIRFYSLLPLLDDGMRPHVALLEEAQDAADEQMAAPVSPGLLHGVGLKLPATVAMARVEQPALFIVDLPDVHHHPGLLLCSVHSHSSQGPVSRVVVPRR